MPTEDTVLLNSELLFFIVRILNLLKTLIRKNTLLNCDVFISKVLTTLGGNGWVLGWSGDQL